MNDLKNIVEMDYPKQKLHGYFVRIQRDGKKHARMFSVSKCGSKEKALAQAINYRDHILERWELFCGGKNEIIQYQTTNSGYPGISITEDNGHPVLEVNLKDSDGKTKVRTLNLPPKDQKNYEKAFEEQFAKAQSMVDDYNRRRFGGRWQAYKKRKNLVN